MNYVLNLKFVIKMKLLIKRSTIFLAYEKIILSMPLSDSGESGIRLLALAVKSLALIKLYLLNTNCF